MVTMLMPNFSSGCVKDLCVLLLSNEWPLTAKETYYRIKKRFGVSITYQAVFKTLQELVENDIIKKRNKKYQINIAWLNRLHDTIEKIKSHYLMKESFEKGMEFAKTIYNFDSRVMSFVQKIGPRAEEFFNQEGAIITLKGNEVYGIALKNYLESKNYDIKLQEVDREEPEINLEKIKNIDVVVVDGSIHTGTSYKRVMKELQELKDRNKIRYAVEHDMKGLSDWSCENNDVLFEKESINEENKPPA